MLYCWTESKTQSCLHTSMELQTKIEISRSKLCVYSLFQAVRPWSRRHSLHCWVMQESRCLDRVIFSLFRCTVKNNISTLTGLASLCNHFRCLWKRAWLYVMQRSSDFVRLNNFKDGLRYISFIRRCKEPKHVVPCIYYFSSFDLRGSCT